MQGHDDSPGTQRQTVARAGPSGDPARGGGEKRDGRARLRLFRTARAIGDQWLVLDGLAAGEQVVVAGAQGLADGMTVRVKPAPAPVGKD